MNKKEIKNKTNLEEIPVFDYDDEPEEIPSIEKFKLSLNNNTKEEQNNNITNNNKIENTPQITKEQLIKELSDNLGIEMPLNDTNTNNIDVKKSLTTIQEVTNESMSHPSFNSVNEKKEIKKEEIIEDSIIPSNTFDNQNDLMSFYGVNNDIENIVNNLQFNDNLKQDFSIIVDDYLEVVQFNKINQEQIKKIILTINQKDLSDCKRVMESLDYDGKIISKISDIDYLLVKAKEIDNKDMEEIKKKNEEKDNCLYAWRDILPGEDSFFRAIMFSFLEEIILSRNINNYLIFLYELSKNIENNFFKNILSYYKIEYLKPKYCLILIYYALTIQDIQTSIEKAHSLLIKIYNYDINFDLLLILNLKFLIYKYLKNNERKLYTREYSVQIGSLLPSQYKVQKGNYNFKEYYSNSLLQLNKEPERITISVIPFILRRDLFIYSFDQKKMSHILVHADKKNQEFIPFRLVILNGSYDIIYQKEYYNQSNKIFSIFSNISNNNKVLKKIINEDNLKNEKFLDIDDDEEDENKKKDEEFKISQNINLENIINNTNNIKISNNNNLDNKMIGQENKNSINPPKKSFNSNYNTNSINNNYFNNYEKNNMNYIQKNNTNNYCQTINNDLMKSNQNTITNNLNNNANNNINTNIDGEVAFNNFMNNDNNNINQNNNNVNIFNNTNFKAYYNNNNNNIINLKSNNINNSKNINNNIENKDITVSNNQNIEKKDALEAFLELPFDPKINNNKTMRNPSTNKERNSLKPPQVNHIKHKSDFSNNQNLNGANNVNKDKECPSCKKPGIDNFYCQNCLLNHLIPLVRNSYIQFIKNNISNLIKFRPKENLSTFLKNLKLPFPNKMIKSFPEVYKLLSDNNKIHFKEKLNNFKSSLCLGCFKIVNQKNAFISYSERGNEKNVFLFKFPCGCIFCSENCLNRFINAVPITRINSFICGCGVEYDYIQLKFLLYFAMSHNLIKFKNEILRYMYDIIKNKCCRCNIEIPLVQEKKNNVNIMEVTDKEAEKIFGIQKFNHLICEKCVKNKEIAKKQFFCSLCSSEHSIISKLKINNCQIRNTCSIF